MKIKLFCALLAVALIAFCFASCKVASGDPTFTIDENGYLIAEYPNGNTKLVGSVRPADGKDGKGITSAIVNDKGELILTFTNGEQTNLGNIIGKDGKDGRDGMDGTNGANGQDGVGVESVAIRDGQLYIKYTNGQIAPLGKVVGEDGRGIRSIRLIGDVWYIQYTDDTTETVVAETEGLESTETTEDGWGELIPIS